MASLLLGRAGRFRLERLPELVDRVRNLRPDHILITGDVTTTALPAEFRAAQAGLADWLGDPTTTTIIPGNHDRYTLYAHVSGRFERFFGDFSPTKALSLAAQLDAETAILGLDPTRSGISASGKLPRSQIVAARGLVTTAAPVPRLVIACHYPAAVPPRFRREYAMKPLVDRIALVEWLATIGPHIYCCGHVHSAWAYQPDELPNQLCLNSGAPCCAMKRVCARPASWKSRSRGPVSMSSTTVGRAMAGTFAFSFNRATFLGSITLGRGDRTTRRAGPVRGIEMSPSRGKESDGRDARANACLNVGPSPWITGSSFSVLAMMVMARDLGGPLSHELRDRLVGDMTVVDLLERPHPVVHRRLRRRCPRECPRRTY